MSIERTSMTIDGNLPDDYCVAVRWRTWEGEEWAEIQYYGDDETQIICLPLPAMRQLCAWFQAQEPPSPGTPPPP